MRPPKLAQKGQVLDPSWTLELGLPPKTAELFSVHLGEKLSRVSLSCRLVVARRTSRISDKSEITAYKPIRQPEKQPLRLTIPREERLARVADALLDDVGDDRTLDDWAHVAGMARRTFMRAFSAQVGMSFGRWRQQARLFAALEMLAQRKSVTEVAIAVGYDSVSAFIEMFRTMLGTTPQTYFRSRQELGLK